MTDTADSSSREQRIKIVKSAVEQINVLSEEQHAFKESMRYILSSTYMSTAATREAILELFPPESLVSSSCLKLPTMFFKFREVLRLCGMTVDQRKGLYEPQELLNVVYSDDAQLLNNANSYLAEYKWSTPRGISSSPTSEHRSGVNQESFGIESDWRKVDAVIRGFLDGESIVEF